jgi:nucleoside-diphosphate-sugar epimerase
MRVLVCGAGGFIGHHLVKRLKADGHWVRGVDLKRPEYELSAADEFSIMDLRDPASAYDSMVNGIDHVFQLAADMGGIGYITAHHADISRNNVLINLNMLRAATSAKVERYLYTSSACVYPAHLQHETNVTALRESDAVPADPEPGYGWEKLFSEQLTAYYAHDYGLNTRTVRLHNIYGPLGTWDGGREKAPAALCRKVAEAKDTLELWGDGQQTRSFCYVDDCVEGLVRIMASEHHDPINLGTEEMVTVNELAAQVQSIAGKSLQWVHDTTKPQGVRGRNSDNTILRKVLNWEPRITLREGLEATYPWIKSQVEARAA